MRKHSALLLGVIFVALASFGAISLLLATENQSKKTETKKEETEEISQKDPNEDTVFQFDGLALGTGMNNETDPNVLMSDVIRLENDTYRMYYNAGTKGKGLIKYAESPDGQTNWEVKGTALTGGSNPEDDDYIIGGSRVLQLQDGTWRMYYRATPNVDDKEPPSYSIYLATSTDGKTFTKYGVVIANDREDLKSNFTLAGHGTFYQLEDGTFAGFFSGNTKDQTSSPSDLFFTTSKDGITWEEPERTYVGVHDPSLVKTDNGYVLVAMYLKEWVGIAQSEDGKTWPKEMDQFSIVDKGGEDINLQQIGDLSITEGSNNTLYLYSNYAEESTRGIAQYVQEN